MKRRLQHNGGFLILLLCFGIFRTAIADWNTVPSGSMRPTILEGDVVEMQNEVVFVNGVAAEYKSPTQVVERLEGGGTTTGLRTTERLEGREHAVQFLPDRAAVMALFGPLPHAQCAMDAGSRAAFEALDAQTKAALDPILFEHRDRMYAEHLELALSL